MFLCVVILLPPVLLCVLNLSLLRKRAKAKLVTVKNNESTIYFWNSPVVQSPCPSPTCLIVLVGLLMVFCHLALAALQYTYLGMNIGTKAVPPCFA
jgi:hypothetical protein